MPLTYSTATAGGQSVPVAICPQCGHITRIERQKCGCGRLHRFKARIGQFSDTADLSVCLDCHKIHAHSRDDAQTVLKAFVVCPRPSLGLMWKSAHKQHVIPTPRHPNGKVNFEQVPTGSSIWITIRDEHSPLHGRRIIVTKRNDGMFAVTGGAGGHWHAALEMGKQRELTPEQQQKRAEAEGQRGEYKQKLGEWEKNNPEVGQHKTALRAAQGAVRASLGLQSDEELMKRLKKGDNSLHERAKAALLAAGADEKKAHSLAGQLVTAEKRRLQEVQNRLAQQARTVNYVHRYIGEAIQNGEGIDWDEVGAMLRHVGFDDKKVGVLQKRVAAKIAESPSNETKTAEPGTNGPQNETKPPVGETKSARGETDTSESGNRAPEVSGPAIVPPEGGPHHAVMQEAADALGAAFAPLLHQAQAADGKELNLNSFKDHDAVHRALDEEDDDRAAEAMHDAHADLLGDEGLGDDDADGIGAGPVKAQDTSAGEPEKPEHRAAFEQAQHHLKAVLDLEAKKRAALRSRPKAPAPAEIHSPLASMAFRTGADAGDEPTPEALAQSIADQTRNAIHEEQRGGFYQKIAQLGTDSDGTIDGDNPFGHLKTHMDAGAVEALNRVAAQFLNTDAIGTDVVGALGIQGASEALLRHINDNGVPPHAVGQWLKGELHKREMPTVRSALDRQKQLEDEAKLIDERAQSRIHGAPELGAAHALDLRLDNMARQHENMGKALGSLEALGSLHYLVDRAARKGGKLSRNVEFSVGADESGMRQRIAGLGARAASNTQYSTNSKGERVAAVPVAALKARLEKRRDVSDTERKLTELGDAKNYEPGGSQEQAGKAIDIKGVAKDINGKPVSLRLAQRADIAHYMHQMDVVGQHEKKGTAPSIRPVRGVGLLINREVGGGKSLSTLAIARDLLNRTHSDALGDHANRPVVITAPDALLGNWAAQLKQWLPGTEAVIVGAGGTGDRGAGDRGGDEDEAGSARFFQNKESRAKAYDKIGKPGGPRVIIVGQNALTAKHTVNGEQVPEYELLNRMKPLMVAHDEPQRMQTSKRGTLGASGQAAVRMGVPSKEDRALGNDWNSVHIGLTATPATKDAGQLHDIGNWVSHGGLGSKTKWNRRNGTLGAGTNAFEGDLGEGILKKLARHMNSDAAAKEHTPREENHLVHMTPVQRQRAAGIETEYDNKIKRLQDAKAGDIVHVRRSTSGKRDWREVKVAAADPNAPAGKREAGTITTQDVARELATAKADRDQAHFSNLYGAPTQGDYRSVASISKVRETIDDHLKRNPDGKIALFAHNEASLNAIKGLLRNEYSQHKFAQMWSNKEMEPGRKAFTEDPATKFAIVGPRGYAGFNLQRGTAAIFHGVPHDAADHIQSLGRIERDPRLGDPETTHIQYADAPVEHQYNHVRESAGRLISATNRAVRGRKPQPFRRDATDVDARADAYRAA